MGWYNLEVQRLEDVVGEVVCREPQFTALAYHMGSRDGQLTFNVLGRTLNPYELTYGAVLYTLVYAFLAARNFLGIHWTLFQ